MSVTFSPSTGFLMGERRAILVGRAADMRELDDALDAVRAKKQCRAVTVIGAAGVGKTRLVREFLMRVHTGDRPPRIFRGWPSFITCAAACTAAAFSSTTFTSPFSCSRASLTQSRRI